MQLQTGELIRYLLTDQFLESKLRLVTDHSSSPGLQIGTDLLSLQLLRLQLQQFDSLFDFNSSILSSTSTSSTCWKIATTSSTYWRIASTSPGLSTIVLIESEDQFNESLRKVQDELLPAIFYFTAVWCGPCRLLSPIIGQLSEKYPRVTTYKIDIDQKGLEGVLSKLDINSVPTLHFFHGGKKAAEIIGADVQRLKDTMENLYK